MQLKWWTGAMLAVLAVSALAGGRGAIRKQAEASMLVTGEIQVDLQGHLKSYQFDQAEKIPDVVKHFLASNIEQWQFDVDGVPAEASGTAVIRNRMSLRVVASRQDGQNYQMRMSGSSFMPWAPDKTHVVQTLTLTPPRYPESAARVGMSGTVYLLVKVDRDGTVQDVLSEQVNLRAAAANEHEMRAWREKFAKASIVAARKWTFIPPSRGEEVDHPFWLVRVPVDYSMQFRGPVYGQWMSYVPGPRQLNPWRDDNAEAGFSPDALAATGGVYMVGQGLRLRAPRQRGG